MRSSISRAQWYQILSDNDKIHDPEIYHIDPEDQSRIEVDTFWPDFSTQANTETAVGQKPLDVWQPPMVHNNHRAALKAKIRESHHKIHQRAYSAYSTITPRTQAHNRKCSEKTIEEERATRSYKVGAQIKAWR